MATHDIRKKDQRIIDRAILRRIRFELNKPKPDVKTLEKLMMDVVGFRRLSLLDRVMSEAGLLEQLIAADRRSSTTIGFRSALEVFLNVGHRSLKDPEKWRSAWRKYSARREMRQEYSVYTKR